MTIETTDEPLSGETVDDTIPDESTQTSLETGVTPAADAPAVPAASSSESEAKTLLEAVTAGIEEGQKPRKVTPKAEEEAADDSRPRNADGTFKTETAEEKTAREAADAEAIARKDETPEQKAAREAEELKKKPVDAINDPLPEGLNKRTTERIKTLIETVKAQGTLVEQHTKMFDSIQGTGASPEEFGTMVGYLGAVRSNDPAAMERAYGILQSELRGLAVRMGKPLPEVNLLRDPANVDLVNEIRDGKISNPRAHEIALMREQQKQGRTTTAAKTEADTHATAQSTATEELRVLGNQLQARDGAVYDAKYNQIVPILKETFKDVHPSKWKAMFERAYNNLKIEAPAPVARVVPKQMPLRPKAPAGGAAPAGGPKSALEAINTALEG